MCVGGIVVYYCVWICKWCLVYVCVQYDKLGIVYQIGERSYIEHFFSRGEKKFFLYFYMYLCAELVEVIITMEQNIIIAFQRK